MKKLRKLQLTKETVANLSGNEMYNLKGAGDDGLVENPNLWTSRETCPTWSAKGVCTSNSCKFLICIPF